VEGLSLGEVVDRLAERGVSTATGKSRWDRATIRGILTHPAYTGSAKYPRSRLSPRKPGRRPKRGDPSLPRREKVASPTSPDEQYAITVPAIVSPELFATVAERLEENRRRYRHQKQGAEFLLSGLLVCHRCGSAYCGHRLKRRHGRAPYSYYHCLGTDKYRHGGEAICSNASLNGDRWEAVVWSDVCSLLKDPQRLRRECQRRLDHSPGEDVAMPHLEKSLAQLKRRMGRLIDAYENGWLDKSDFEPRIQHVRQRLAREQEALAQRQREQASEAELRLLVGQFETFTQHIADGLEQADFETKRRLLRLLIHRIEVDQDEIRIVYKVQPHPFVPSPAKRGVLQDCLNFRETPSA